MLPADLRGKVPAVPRRVAGNAVTGAVITVDLATDDKAAIEARVHAACRAALAAPVLRSASQQNNYLCSPDGTRWYGADGGLSPLGSKRGNINTNWNYQVPNNIYDVDFGAGRPDRWAGLPRVSPPRSRLHDRVSLAAASRGVGRR